ncbi:MAG: LuxR C-terminal-related transcriptional regulator [Cyanobacteria bacterium J06621_8]
MDQDKFQQAIAKLTSKQSEVLQRILSGETDEEIAQDLGIKPATVRKYVERIYSAFNSFKDSPDQKLARRVDLFALVASHKPEWMNNKATTLSNIPPDLANPFIPLTGVIENPKLFFNRQQEMREIFSIFNSGASVALVGERGIGKSSLLKAICREAANNLMESRKPIYLNLQNIENDDDFYDYLCDELGFKETLRGYQLTRCLKNAEKILLAIDEIETIVTNDFASQIPAHLRGLAAGMNAPLRLIMAGKKSLGELYDAEGLTSPLMNICLTVEVECWDEDTIRAFIAERIASTSVTFNEDTIADLVKESEGHPQKLMELCNQAYKEHASKT